VRLWRDYARRFGTARTVAFSVVASPGRFSQLIRDLDQTGLRPPEYAVDVYGDEASRLALVGQELRTANEGGKALIVLEVYYNDAATAGQIEQARRTLPQIRTLFQWQLERGVAQNHFSVHYPERFENYLPLFK
jgi:hypothetical protein